MAFPVIPVVSTVTGLFSTLIDRLLPDENARAEAKRQLMELEQSGELQMMQTQIAAILAEAKSEDKWTSRARPSFLYLIYFVIFYCIFVIPPLAIAFPEHLIYGIDAMKSALNAIPESLYWLFGSGYLGYTGGRTFDKWQASRGR